MPNDAEFLHEITDGPTLRRLVFTDPDIIGTPATDWTITASSHQVTTVIFGNAVVTDTLTRFTPTTWSYNADL